MNNQAGVNVLLASDQQNSVLFEANKAHSSQNLPYSCYGLLPALGNTLGFNGERLEPLTDNYLLGNGLRAFNPVLMRFNSPDNMSPFAAGGVNSYAYCLGDPINRRDPSGNISESLRRFFKKSPTQRNLPASVKIETSDTYTTSTYTRTYTTDKFPMNIVNSPKNIPEGWQLIGLHGTKTIEDVNSLESGLDISHSGGGLAGRGTYITQYAELANNFTGHDGSGYIVGVYVKDFSRWIEGVHFTRLHSQVMVIHERAYYAVKMSRDIKFPMVFDTTYAENPSDEPYGGRSWF
ncbi:RHS repeat-associated core domain-containing protein [Pseudomonas carassii]|uniref:RHS repeat-associated core domain-containing protein n=1 Tax=Pseudomonas carassii TaxID=3115855 RepID=A0ABU7HA63_9PSED|nr:RHS repeat-associated core domain-containing protein [Pseudomonas sp. 137P]MEE1888200.1 RHS repeat-associated core domain-containing protein [Pseudomonas sp. 137P]